MSTPLDQGAHTPLGCAFGVYTCRWCKKEYTVNRPDTWNRCTPDYCHDCVMRFDAARLETGT